MKVAWVGAHKAPEDERGVGYAVASLFGGEKKPDTKGRNLIEEDPLDDSDIPF